MMINEKLDNLSVSAAAERPKKAAPAFARFPLALLAAAVLLLASISLNGCSDEKSGDIEKNRTLTSDERYLANTYVKIHKIEKNLQSNPGEIEKKLAGIREQTDSARIHKTVLELEKDPKRWIAVYGRINELLERNDSNSGD